jgi:AmiR/NasT family two-component response regulator
LIVYVFKSYYYLLMEKLVQQFEELKVLVVGNNPIDLSHTFESLSKISGHKVITEIAFDLASIIDRLSHFRPTYILIDDNMGQPELKATVLALSVNRKTRHVPITVLKNSNYHEAMNTGVMNYILKETITGDSLYTALKNSLKFKKTQLYLQQAYKKRKGQLLRILKSN